MNQNDGARNALAGDTAATNQRVELERIQLARDAKAAERDRTASEHETWRHAIVATLLAGVAVAALVAVNKNDALDNEAEASRVKAQAQAMVDMVKAGADPIEAACAFGHRSVCDQIGTIAAMRAKVDHD